MDETGVPGENTYLSQTLSHNGVLSTPRLCYFSSILSQNCVSPILITRIKITNNKSDPKQQVALILICGWMVLLL